MTHPRIVDAHLVRPRTAGPCADILLLREERDRPSRAEEGRSGSQNDVEDGMLRCSEADVWTWWAEISAPFAHHVVGSANRETEYGGMKVLDGQEQWRERTWSRADDGRADV